MKPLLILLLLMTVFCIEENKSNLLHQNMLYMIKETPKEISNVLCDMYSQYYEKYTSADDYAVWELLVSDYLLSHGLPPLNYHYYLKDQNWKPTFTFLSQEQEKKRLECLKHLHELNSKESTTSLNTKELEAKGRMLRDKNEWFEFSSKCESLVKNNKVDQEL